MQEVLRKILDKVSNTVPERNSRALVIDGTNLFIRVFSAIPDVSESGNHIGGVWGFISSLSALIRNFGPTRCLVVFDGYGGSVRRKKIFPDYKSQRTRKKLNRYSADVSLEEERESMKKQFSRLLEYMETLPITTIMLDNVEADDVISYAVKDFLEIKCDSVIISSTDRDFLQMVSDKVSVWSPIKKIMYTPDALKKETGIISENYILYRVVSGDISDNIPGVGGVSLANLKKYFPVSEQKMHYKDLIKYSNEQINSGTKYKIYHNILQSEQILKRNQDLMQLSDVEIPNHFKVSIIDILNDDVEFDKNKFQSLITEDKLNFEIRNLEDWVSKNLRTIIYV
jgi:DNA polymerase-1